MKKIFHRKSSRSLSARVDIFQAASVGSSSSSHALHVPGVQEQALGLSLLTPDSENALVDIVAVHGLNGDPIQTWTAENSRFWLKDFLPITFPYARVFTFGYTSKLVFSKSAATIVDFAISLLDELDNARTLEEERHRPIVFIGHSLGGIVIKKAIITAHDQEQRYKGILHSTRGIVFLGTPHAGSKLATWTRYSRNIIDAATVGPSLTRKGLLKDLEQNSESLKVISESFRHRATELWITSFYERLFTMPMKGLVVLQGSAVIGFPKEEALPMDADHQNICKFSTPETQSWRSLSNAIRRQLEGLKLDAQYTEKVDLKRALRPANKAVRERIEKLLSPLSFTDNIEQKTYFERCPYTGEWIFTHATFKDWQLAVPGELLWIHGGAGSGKTFLTSLIADHFLKGHIVPRSMIAFFACDLSRQDPDRPQDAALFATILAQLLNYVAALDEPIASDVSNDLEATISATRSLTPYRIWLNFLRVTERVKKCIIIIDALDECNEWQEVLIFFQRLVDESPGQVKVLISSRSLDTARELLGTGSSNVLIKEIELDTHTMSPDVTKLIEWKTKHLDMRGVENRTHITEILLEDAKGSILLAHYRIEALKYFLRRGGNLTLSAAWLDKLPKEVEEHYNLTVARIQKLSSEDQKVARAFFTWVTYVARPLKFDEIVDITTRKSVKGLAQERRSVSRSWLDDTFLGLLILRNDEVLVSHGSIHEYLRQGGFERLFNNQREIKDEMLTHSELAISTLDYLCSAPNPNLIQGITWGTNDVKEHPFLRYTLNYWPHHVFSALGFVSQEFFEFMRSYQALHWWECWSQGSPHKNPQKAFGSLQAIFTQWLQSLQHPEARLVRSLVGSNLPIFMQKRIIEEHEKGPEPGRNRMFNRLSILCQLQVMSEQWPEALEIALKAREINSVVDERTGNLVQQLAVIYRFQGERKKALDLKQDIYNFSQRKFGEINVQTLIALDNLAVEHIAVSDTRTADELSLKALRTAEKLLGDTHPETAQIKANRSVVLLQAYRLEEALTIAQEAAKNMVHELGVGHRMATIASDNIAEIYFAMENLEAAMETRQEAFRLAKLTLGKEDETTIAIREGLYDILEKSDDWTTLSSLRRERVNDLIFEYGVDADQTLVGLNELVLSLMQGGDMNEAKSVAETLVRGLRQRGWFEKSLYHLAIQKLTKIYDFTEDYEAGAKLGEEVIERYRRTRGFCNSFGLSALRDQARIYHRLNDCESAVKYGILAVETSKELHGDYSRDTLAVQRDLAGAYWKAGNPEQGLQLDRVVYNNSKLINTSSSPEKVADLINFVAPMKGKDKNTVFWAVKELAYTQKDCSKTFGDDHETVKDLQARIDVFYQHLPEEWHVEMTKVIDSVRATEDLPTQCAEISLPLALPDAQQKQIEPDNEFNESLSGLNSLLARQGLRAIASDNLQEYLATPEVQSAFRDSHEGSGDGLPSQDAASK